MNPKGPSPTHAPREGVNERSLRRRTYFILEVDRFGDRLSRFVDIALVVLIITNVIVAVLQTVDEYEQAALPFFEIFELISMVLFGLEYLLRVWSCVEDPELGAAHEGPRGPIRDRVRFMLQPMMLIDLAVLVLPLFDLRPLRVIRLLRLGRYSPRLRLFGSVLRAKREELGVGLFIAVVLLIACSTAMYHVEGNREGSSFQSIPQTMWWGVATLTTVGYGDVYPVTNLGKALGSIVALLGVGIFALPAGILASGFADALSDEKKNGTDGQENEAPDGMDSSSGPGFDQGARASGTCPHCGASLSEN